MPIPTPFHARTQPLCLTYKWKDWAGYHSPSAYGLSPEREYNAIRHGAGLLDVTPLFKYDVSGDDAALFLSRVLSRDVRSLKAGRMTYVCWCDDHGKVIDDGTCARLADGRLRLTAAAPALHWLLRHARGYDVAIEDVSAKLAALALQGPTSRAILRDACGEGIDALKFFGVLDLRFDGFSAVVSRTGYTGDLGYEIWVENEHAVRLWDALIAAGKKHNLEPIGLDALDISRVEAGFVLRGIDYQGANEALIDAQKSSPFELGLGWTVTLDGEREPFIGQAALAREKLEGSPWALVGLDIDWPSIEALYAEHDLPPHASQAAWRTAVPVYRDGRQVGRATSGTWSPTLKKNLALATVEASASQPGTQLYIEWTVEWARQVVPAVVAKTPFFDPPRKRA
ncbi:MAG: aminomethyl transferase family protein [Myxococcales bacterium]|nr:aminomethyl transferase family protein [Myxococcales bacterium]